MEGGGRGVDELTQKVSGDMPIEQVAFKLVVVGAQAGVAGPLIRALVEVGNECCCDFSESFGELAQVTGTARHLFVQHGQLQQS